MNDFIKDLLMSKYQDETLVNTIYSSPFIQYLVKETSSVNKSSKARASLGNLYALYALIEDYIVNGFVESGQYSQYEGMMFSKAFKRHRELPMGEKLQNHAFNNRCNDKFKRLTKSEEVPIIRNLETNRYWINEKLLLVGKHNIARDIIDIIEKYIELRLLGFERFFNECIEQRAGYEQNPEKATSFILRLLAPETDARIFEIVAFCIIKYYYHNQMVYFGETKDQIKEVPVALYKTGRTNANDGGIDFIMQPYGRIFQVTEVLDFKKYFLDIDKLNHYKITFVVKTEMSSEEVLKVITEQAAVSYPLPELRNKYLACFEEIITIDSLKEYMQKIIEKQLLGDLLDELILQCKVEYNLDDSIEVEE